MRTLKEFLNEGLSVKDSVIADASTKHKDGTHTFRRGFFYTGGKSSQDFADSVSAQLDKEGHKHTILDHGEHWAAFKGGASVAKQSHWWVKVKVHPR